MELSIDALKEKFLNMNSDIELIERKLKDEMCKMYEDDINPFLILNDFENIKHELSKINKELDNLYERKKISINYMHRQMQNYNFLLNLENNLDIASKQFSNYHNSEIILNNFFYDNIKKFLLHINYDEIKELIQLDNQQKYLDNKEVNSSGQLSGRYNETVNGKNLPTNCANFKYSVNSGELKENKNKILNNDTTTNDNKLGKIGKTNNKNTGDTDYLFNPIDDATFQSVPALIRRRAKLDDINVIYKALYDMALKKGSCLPVEKSELTQMNLQVFGQTGEAKIATLRYLKIIEVTNNSRAHSHDPSVRHFFVQLFVFNRDLMSTLHFIVYLIEIFVFHYKCICYFFLFHFISFFLIFII
ncbi:conserved protein, unknown function [Plasmodium malariae]|uniref:Protein FAM33A n=1 Tax=Plasmodium malariae TaxID=5858 RepID=A0A1C3KYY9_PLAMA|nr:conserved protein, unknown function [Plasmodium malariae]